MMPTLLEREELSGAMKTALRNHIKREREKKKREEKEAEKDFERRAKIEEERKRKEKEDSVNLEQIKDQLASSGKKLDNLKIEKHSLFVQLKKVLQEEEKRKKEKELKELGELNAAHYGHPIQNLMMPGGHYQPHQMPYYSGQSSPHVHPSLRQAINQVHPQPIQHGVKRPHSPSSPQPSPIQLFQRNALASGHGLHLPTAQHPKYEHGYNNHPTSHLGVVNSSNSGAQSTNMMGTPSRHISVLHNVSPGRASGSKSPYSLGKSHDNVNPVSGFNDDHMNNLSSRPNIRMIPQQSGLIPQPISASPRSRSGSPGRFATMHTDKSHSPYHGTSPIVGGRFYK